MSLHREKNWVSSFFFFKRVNLLCRYVAYEDDDEQEITLGKGVEKVGFLKVGLHKLNPVDP